MVNTDIVTLTDLQPIPALIARDFQPINKWKVDIDGPQFEENPGVPKYRIDESTGRLYLNEQKVIVRLKCYTLIFATLPAHGIFLIGSVASRALKLATLSHFWCSKGRLKKYCLKARACNAGKDLLKIATHPFIVVGLEASAVYGGFQPYDGRKLYASFERAQYEKSMLAPCFQPDSKKHLLGGDIESRGAF